MLAGIVMAMVLEPSIALTMLRASPDKIEAQPKSGDLVAEVKEQLANDHSKLGKVSASLMSVQNEVDKTEQSMLGKVLDLQTAKTFFSRHQEIDTSNDKMQDENSKLNTQVEGLSGSLSKTQREFLSNGMEYRAAEGKLKEQVVQNEALIGSMNAELAKEDEIQKELNRLTAIHQNLMAQSVNATQTGRAANTMLEEARANSRNEVKRHKSLRDQLISMNNYSVACHAKVEKQSKALGAAMMTESKDNQALKLTMGQKQKANDATSQRLLAERALLVSEVKRVETEGLEEVKRLQDLREDLRELENNIIAEVKELTAKINTHQERVKSLSVDLMENQQAEEAHNAKKEAMEAHLLELTKEVRESENPVTIATTEAQNEALQSELNEAYGMWKTSKKSETTALLNVDQAVSTHKAVKAGLAEADKALVTARNEGRDKVAEAVKAAMVSKANSAALLQKAEAAVAERCKADWDEIWKAKRSKLVKCKQMKEELSMEEAKKETLMTTLQAQAEAS